MFLYPFLSMFLCQMILYLKFPTSKWSYKSCSALPHCAAQKVFATRHFDFVISKCAAGSAAKAKPTSTRLQLYLKDLCRPACTAAPPLLLFALTFFRCLFCCCRFVLSHPVCVCAGSVSLKFLSRNRRPVVIIATAANKEKKKKHKARSDAMARGARAVAKLFTIRNCRPFWYWINMLNVHAAQLAHCTSCRHLAWLFGPDSPLPSLGECNAQFPQLCTKCWPKSCINCFGNNSRGKSKRRLCKPDWMAGNEVSPTRRGRRRRRRRQWSMAKPEAAQRQLPPSPPASVQSYS